MPSWDSVKDMKTPTAYSGISAVVMPPKAMISSDEAPARTRTPLENTSRSPRFASWRGRNPSRAMIDESRGKSAYAVLAARVRIAAVAIWRAR